ncbi:MAG: hypothetical protein PHY32_03540 [Candidatus Pacebacteria bacterium]|nr:hypothetical protein [Candidatus Paceibacterota bacterium]
MYYDASSTDYISTPSFAIPNTGILTVGAWIKSKIYSPAYQGIIGDNAWSSTVGYIFINRVGPDDRIQYRYASGTDQYAYFPNFFTNLDNQ